MVCRILHAGCCAYANAGSCHLLAGKAYDLWCLCYLCPWNRADSLSNSYGFSCLPATNDKTVDRINRSGILWNVEGCTGSLQRAAAVQWGATTSNNCFCAASTTTAKGWGIHRRGWNGVAESWSWIPKGGKCIIPPNMRGSTDTCDVTGYRHIESRW